jgi:hypothetical protein
MNRSKAPTASARRRRRGFIAGAVLALAMMTALVLSVSANAVTHTTGLFGPHVGASSATFSQGDDCPTLAEGTVLWHFVLPQTVLPLGSGVTGNLDVSFDGGALTFSDVPYTKIAGSVIHWDVTTTGGDHTLDSAWTDASSTAPPTPLFAIRLSHVCGGGTPQFDATLATNVHDSSHTNITNSSVALGTPIHDLATVSTVTGTVASGTVHFALYKGLDCGDTGSFVDNVDVALGTDNASEPLPGLTSLQATTTPRTLGAGGYSYAVTADLTSDGGQPLFVGADECEPFTVNKGDLTIRTDIHNYLHQVITSADAGAVVHDTATLGGAVTGFDPDLSKISFTFWGNNNNTCSGTGTTVGQELPEGTYVARTVNSAALAVGLYSYQASFSGDENYNAIEDPSDCEPLQIFRAALTIGYWKTHMHVCARNEKQATAGCSSNGPFTVAYLGWSICNGCSIVGMLGNYNATTESKALGVFNANNCSNASSSDANAAACLAAQLLAAQLNVANGANTCICDTIVAAKQFLIAVGYNGPGQPVSFSGTNTRAKAIQLKTALDNYNNAKGCPV